MHWCVIRPACKHSIILMSVLPQYHSSNSTISGYLMISVSNSLLFFGMGMSVIIAHNPFKCETRVQEVVAEGSHD